MTRKTNEWIASHDDQAIPARVKLRIFETFGGKCAICTRRVVVAAFDHRDALINGGQHREGNLQLLCASPCHSEKTAGDVKLKAKVARVRKRHLGIKNAKPKIQSPGFSRSKPQRTASRPIDRWMP